VILEILGDYFIYSIINFLFLITIIKDAHIINFIIILLVFFIYIKESLLLFSLLATTTIVIIRLKRPLKANQNKNRRRS